MFGAPLPPPFEPKSTNAPPKSRAPESKASVECLSKPKKKKKILHCLSNFGAFNDYEAQTQEGVDEYVQEKARISDLIHAAFLIFTLSLSLSPTLSVLQGIHHHDYISCGHGPTLPGYHLYTPKRPKLH